VNRLLQFAAAFLLGVAAVIASALAVVTDPDGREVARERTRQQPLT
jgi:hypothetical protein